MITAVRRARILRASIDLAERRACNRASVQGAKRLRRRGSGRAICPATALRKDFRLAPARPSIGANFAGRAQQFRETPQ